MRYTDVEDLEPLNVHKFSEALTEKASFHTPKSVSPKSLSVKYLHTIFPSPPLVRKVPLALSLVQTITETSSPDMMLKIQAHKVPHKSSHHLRFYAVFFQRGFVLLILSEVGFRVLKDLILATLLQSHQFPESAYDRDVGWAEDNSENSPKKELLKKAFQDLAA
ncbi:hypothetical protein Tco_0435319 [Tanacetum coccineum]